MLTFLTAFLGLVLGVQPVELEVSGPVAAVELRLDGRAVGRLQGAPWVLAVDFGSELEPHELVAVGFDERGDEVARVARWINLPQPRSRAELVLDDDGRTARLVWQSADGAVPDAWRIRFDGEVLDVADPSSFTLPSYDAESLHVLQAELGFGRSLAQVERIVGGQAGDTIETEMTALAMSVEEGKAPTPEEMEGWLWRDGRALEVVSVERDGGSDVVLVQDATPRTWGRLNQLRGDALRTVNRSFVNQRLTSGLHADDRLRVMLPLAERVGGAVMDQFHISADFARPVEGPTSMGATNQAVAAPRAEGVLAALPYPPEGPLIDEAPRRTADAVAVAAQVATAPRRTRAVVLVRDAHTADAGVHDPATVRRYLEHLQVPLLVWAPDGDETGEDGWGPRRDVSTFRELQRAVIELRQILDRQVVVWVRGRHRPQDVELSAEARQRLSPVGLLFGEERPEAPDVPELLPETRTASWDEPEAPADLEPAAASPASPATPATEAITSETTFVDTTLTESVDVRLVSLQVVVTDDQGRRVRDLARDDFELFVDGEPVALSHFVPSPAVDPPNGPSEPEPTPADEPAEAEAVDRETPTRLVIFFDTLRLDTRGRRSLAESLREVLEETDPLETMVVTYDRSLAIALPFTMDRDRIDEVLRRLEEGDGVRAPERDVRTALANRMPRIEQDLKDPELQRRAEADRTALLIELSNLGKSLAADTRAAVDALRRLSTGLGAVEGHNVLLYVGDGLELSPAFELFDEAMETLQLSPLEISGLRSESDSLRLHDTFDALMSDAHAAGVTFYSLTPRNRSSADVVERSKLSYSRPGAQGRMPSVRQELVREAVCFLSGESGGLCQAGGSEPRLLLERAMEDLSSYYTLAFTPPVRDAVEDGGDEGDAFHEVEVRLRRPGLEARHRRGYTDPSDEHRIQERLSAALYFEAEDDALGMTAQLGEIRPTSELSLVPIEVRVPVDRIGLVPDETGTELVADARLLVTTRRGDGTVTGVQEFPITFRVSAERLQSPQPLVYAHKAHLMLPPGDYTVALGLWDDVSELGSFRSLRASVE